ncbi:MAG: sugar transferase [Proteobacteria bacterium]|nr:sugar transferase [Pseudomonadota bacterium]MBS0573055.1 sugar transferase [Pseudomonadota bacterium]
MTMQLNDLRDGIHGVCAAVGTVSVPYRRGIYRNRLKRVCDLSLVILTSPLVVPLVLLLALAVWLDGNRPFYLSERVGRGGRIFRMLKLRTMVEDADDILDGYLQQNDHALREWTDKQKLRDDPRVTAIGRFLRKSSLDELPQLWNVLKGDMSLVGPRPMMPSQRGMYPGLAYYGLRPGLTGLWQISDRNGCDFAKRAEFDSAYDAQLDFATDVVVMLKTCGAVVRGTGY